MTYTVEQRIDEVVQIGHGVGIGRVVNAMRRGREGVCQFVKSEVLHKGQNDVSSRNSIRRQSSFVP